MIIVFSYDQYYPCGGSNDIRWQGDTIDSLEEELKVNSNLVYELKNNDIVEIYNTDTKETIDIEDIKELNIYLTK